MRDAARVLARHHPPPRFARTYTELLDAHSSARLGLFRARAARARWRTPARRRPSLWRLGGRAPRRRSFARALRCAAPPATTRARLLRPPAAPLSSLLGRRRSFRQQVPPTGDRAEAPPAASSRAAPGDPHLARRPPPPGPSASANRSSIPQHATKCMNRGTHNRSQTETPRDTRHTREFAVGLEQRAQPRLSAMSLCRVRRYSLCFRVAVASCSNSSRDGGATINAQSLPWILRRPRCHNLESGAAQFPVGAVSYASAHALRTHAAMPSVSVAAPARSRAAARAAATATRAPAPSAPPPPAPRIIRFSEASSGLAFWFSRKRILSPAALVSFARACASFEHLQAPRRRRPHPRRLSSPRTPARAFGSWARAETGAHTTRHRETDVGGDFARSGASSRPSSVAESFKAGSPSGFCKDSAASAASAWRPEKEQQQEEEVVVVVVVEEEEEVVLVLVVVLVVVEEEEELSWCLRGGGFLGGGVAPSPLDAADALAGSATPAFASTSIHPAAGYVTSAAMAAPRFVSNGRPARRARASSARGTGARAGWWLPRRVGDPFALSAPSPPAAHQQRRPTDGGSTRRRHRRPPPPVGAGSVGRCHTPLATRGCRRAPILRRPRPGGASARRTRGGKARARATARATSSRLVVDRAARPSRGLLRGRPGSVPPRADAREHVRTRAGLCASASDVSAAACTASHATSVAKARAVSDSLYLEATFVVELSYCRNPWYRCCRKWNLKVKKSWGIVTTVHRTHTRQGRTENEVRRPLGYTDHVVTRADARRDVQRARAFSQTLDAAPSTGMAPTLELQSRGRVLERDLLDDLGPAAATPLAGRRSTLRKRVDICVGLVAATDNDRRRRGERASSDSEDVRDAGRARTHCRWRSGTCRALRLARLVLRLVHMAVGVAERAAPLPLSALYSPSYTSPLAKRNVPRPPSCPPCTRPRTHRRWRSGTCRAPVSCPPSTPRLVHIAVGEAERAAFAPSRPPWTAPRTHRPLAKRIVPRPSYCPA